ncbi:unnamed protein product, partial [Heterosigma akashiwo]
LPACRSRPRGSRWARVRARCSRARSMTSSTWDAAKDALSHQQSGGIQGGISNGETIVVKVAFKPTSTIGQLQNTVTRDGTEVEHRGKGRHDPCVLPRAVPMVEAMVALTLADALMQHSAQ